MKERMIDRLRRRAEDAAIRHAAATARSEAEIARRTAAGHPPTEAELARNRQTLGVMAGQAKIAQREFDQWVERHPEQELIRP